MVIFACEGIQMKTKILRILENNARISTSDIANELGLEEQEVIKAIGELEADRVICGYDAISL